MTARRRLLASGLTLALGTGLLVASAGTAAAATITVNSLADTTADDGSCTLPEAIDNANLDDPTHDDCAAGSANEALDTITFSVAGTITLTTPLPSILDPAGLTIQGPGANLLTISGDSTFQVLNVLQPLSLVALTVADGSFAGNGGGIYNDSTLFVTNSTLSGNSATAGGGIFNDSNLTVTNSTLSGNSATNGGGIFNGGGNVTITNSTLSGNSAGVGGGILNDGFLSVTDSTLSGNTAQLGGGGIFHGPGAGAGSVLGDGIGQGNAHIVGSTFEGNHAGCNGGAINNAAYITITNSTFEANTANAYGGGLFNGSFVVTPGTEAEVTHATFSGNSALGEVSLPSGVPPQPVGCRPILPGPQVGQQGPSAGGGIFNVVQSSLGTGGAQLVTLPSPVILEGTIVDHSLEGGDCSGPITDDGYNLDSDATCQLSDETSLIGTDPDLDPLQDNGGPTQTMALNTGSPALDLIPPGVCEDFLGHSPEDQRGIARPQGPGCDVGAFELEPGGTTPPPPDTRWTEQTTIDLRGPFGAASPAWSSLGAERSSFKLKGTLYARHWFCQHNSKINLILVGQGQIGSTFTNGAGNFSFLTSLPQGENQASYKARFPQKKGQPGRCKGSVSDPLVVTGG